MGAFIRFFCLCGACQRQYFPVKLFRKALFETPIHSWYVCKRVCTCLQHSFYEIPALLRYILNVSRIPLRINSNFFHSSQLHLTSAVTHQVRTYPQSSFAMTDAPQNGSWRCSECCLQVMCGVRTGLEKLVCEAADGLENLMAFLLCLKFVFKTDVGHFPV